MVHYVVVYECFGGDVQEFQVFSVHDTLNDACLFLKKTKTDLIPEIVQELNETDEHVYVVDVNNTYHHWYIQKTLY